MRTTNKKPPNYIEAMCCFWCKYFSNTGDDSSLNRCTKHYTHVDEEYVCEDFKE